MVAADVPAACKLACEYLRKFSVAPVFNEPDFAHWLLPRDGVISSFVVEVRQRQPRNDAAVAVPPPSAQVCTIFHAVRTLLRCRGIPQFAPPSPRPSNNNPASSRVIAQDPVSHEITDMISYYTLPSTIVNHPEHSLLKAAYSFYNVAAKTPLHQLMKDALILAKKDNFVRSLDVLSFMALVGRAFGRRLPPARRPSVPPRLSVPPRTLLSPRRTRPVGAVCDKRMRR